MAVFEIAFDSDTYQALQFLQPDLELSSSDWQQWFVGEPMRANWRAVEVEYESVPGKMLGDFPSLGGIPPVFSSRAVDALEPLVATCVEFLPLLSSTAMLYVVNVIKVLDCLDIAKSQVKRFSDGRVMRIEKYAFKDDCLEEAHMFKIPEQVRNRVYVSDVFKRNVERNSLQGMIFHKVAE